MIYALLIVALLLALVWAVNERRACQRWARRHLAASARLHEAQKAIAAERHRSDVLLIRIAREVGMRQEVLEASIAASKLGQLAQHPV